MVRTALGLVIHLINLVGQDEIEWDAGKSDPMAQTGSLCALPPVGEPPALIWATPDEDNGAASVKGHEFLPGGGHQTCPVTVTRTAR